MFHYNKDSATYGVGREGVPLYQDEDDNPLINELGIYILDKLCTYQNMQDFYKVTAETDIDVHVRYFTLLVDGTKIYRFSRELLAYIETCVAFCPYYRQDDPRTAGAMDTYFRDALQNYADVPYKELHDYLARRLNAWYTKFKPPSARVVGEADLPTAAAEQVDGEDGAAPPAKRARYSMSLGDEESAAPAAAGPAAPAAGPAAPAAGGTPVTPP